MTRTLVVVIKRLQNGTGFITRPLRHMRNIIILNNKTNHQRTTLRACLDCDNRMQTMTMTPDDVGIRHKNVSFVRNFGFHRTTWAPVIAKHASGHVRIAANVKVGPSG